MTIKLPGVSTSPRSASGMPAAGTPRPAAGQAPGTGDQGKVSPVPGSQGTVLDPAQLDVVLDALEDAAEYRWAAAPDCGRCGTVLCDDHRADARRGVRYANLGRWLRKAAGR